MNTFKRSWVFFHNDASDTLTQLLPMLRAKFRTVTQRQTQQETLSGSTLTQDDWFESLTKR